MGHIALDRRSAAQAIKQSAMANHHQGALMIGIIGFGLSRGLTHLTMLAENRLADRIAAYGWPLRYLGAPREYEGGKAVAVAAEIEIGPHVLNFTRSKAGIFRPVFVGTKQASTDQAHGRSPALCDWLEAIGAALSAA